MQSLVPCPICGCSDARLRFPSTLGDSEQWTPGFNPYGGHYRINRCTGCGLVFSSPVFDDAAIGALYRDYPQTNTGDSEAGNVRRTMAGYYAMAREHLAGRERMLDIGCDIGLMLDVAGKDGFRELHGIEPVDVAREQAARNVPQARLYAEFYERCDFPENHFDLISLIHVTDHLVHPHRLLDRALGHLKPGGLAVAVVHDIEAPLARLMGERYPVYNFFHHYFFSRDTLSRLFERSGFETVTVRATRNCYSLGFLIARFPLIPRGAAEAVSRWSQAAGIGKLALELPIGNIGIVARKPLR